MKIKQIITLLLLMILAVPQVWAQAQRLVGQESGTLQQYGCDWTWDSGTRTLTVTGNGSIDANAFQDNTDIVTVSIGNSVTGIGNGSFSGCTGIETVIISNSVQSVGENAFGGCSSIRAINIAKDSRLASISAKAFSDAQCTEIFMSCNFMPYIESDAFPAGATVYTTGDTWTTSFYSVKRIYPITAAKDINLVGAKIAWSENYGAVGEKITASTDYTATITVTGNGNTVASASSSCKFTMPEYGVEIQSSSVASYTITVHLDDRGTVSIPSTYTEGDVIELTAPTYDEPKWQFDGWYTNENFNGAPITTIPYDGTLGDKVIYAKWTKLYAVYYAEQDGVSITPYVDDKPMAGKDNTTGYVRPGTEVTLRLGIPWGKSVSEDLTHYGDIKLAKIDNITYTFTMPKEEPKSVGYVGMSVVEGFLLTVAESDDYTCSANGTYLKPGAECSLHFTMKDDAKHIASCTYTYTDEQGNVHDGRIEDITKGFTMPNGPTTITPVVEDIPTHDITLSYDKDLGSCKVYMVNNPIGEPVTSAKAEDVLVVVAEPKDGYVVQGYEFKAEDNATQVRSMENLFKMPKSNVTVTVTFVDAMPEITYYKVDMVRGTIDISTTNAYKLVTKDTKVLGGGEYVVADDVTIEGNVEVTGEKMTSLIICDGKTLTINGDITSDGESYFFVTSQESRSGSLKVNNITLSNEVVVLVCGTLNATKISASSTSIVGGRVTADEIQANNNVALSLEKEGEFVSVTTYSSSRVIVSSPLADEDGQVYEQNYETYNKELDGKTLRPAKIDDDGTVTVDYGALSLSINGEFATKTAELDGNYDGTAPLTIDSDIEEVDVTVNRNYNAGTGYTTISLPFDLVADKVAKLGKFYTVENVYYDNDDSKWVAAVSSVASLTAYKPYLYLPSNPTEMKWTVTLKATPKDAEPFVTTSENNEWQLVSVYQRKTWDSHENQDYGFAATEKTGISIGDFVHAGKGTYIKPFRCYLHYYGTGDPWKTSKSTVALPDRIEVRVVNAVVEPDEPSENPNGDITTPTSEIIAPNANAKVWSYDRTIFIESATGTAFRIIDASGRLLKEGVTSTTREEISLGGNGGGIAVVLIGKKSYKVSY